VLKALTSLYSSTVSGRAKAKKDAVRTLLVVIAILLLSVLAYSAYTVNRNHNDKYAANVFDRLTKQVHTTPVSSGAFTINQLGYSYFKLDVPAKASSVLLHGTFTASGGLGNTIEAFVFSESDYVNWQNRHEVNPFYGSGKVTMGTIDANLPPGAGSYYLVFNNKFSVLAPKTVRVNAELRFYQ
jgi:ABC-type oligopeptide transport system substrate-binding subunit